MSKHTIPISTELRTAADVMVVYKALPPADLLIRAADRIDALGAALQSLNAAIDAMWAALIRDQAEQIENLYAVIDRLGAIDKTESP